MDRTQASHASPVVPLPRPVPAPHRPPAPHAPAALGGDDRVSSSGDRTTGARGRLLNALPAVLLGAGLPAVLIGAYAGLRLFGVRPATESGLGDFLTSSFFVGGAALCYFTGVLHGMAGALRQYACWLAPTTLFLCLAADETLMVHEVVSDVYGVSELFVFAAYGTILLVALYVFRAAPQPFWILFALFVAFCGTAQLMDFFSGREGMVMVKGRGIDVEQVCELLGSSFLCGAYAALASSRLALLLHNRPYPAAPDRPRAGAG